MIYTDGFEPHWSLPDFATLFTLANFPQLKMAIKNFDTALQKTDPEKYGLERTLLVVNL